MEIKEFIRLEDEVKQILIDYPNARNDDMYLYRIYCNIALIKYFQQDVAYETYVKLFSSIFGNKEARKQFNIRPFETISRCRRKIQAQCPELASERAIKRAKKQLEKDYKDYAKL